jgi:arabinogalactan endo-1,4-beta-galactosidase
MLSICKQLNPILKTVVEAVEVDLVLLVVADSNQTESVADPRKKVNFHLFMYSMFNFSHFQLSQIIPLVVAMAVKDRAKVVVVEAATTEEVAVDEETNQVSE